MQRLTLAVAIALLAAVSVGVAYAQGNSESQYPPEKVGVCHATGSETNPYVYLEVPENSAHVTGQHPDDIYPVSSAAECPAGETPGGGTTVVTPPETTTPGGGTTVDVTTPVLPAVELHYICTSEGVDRFAVQNHSPEAVPVTFEDAVTSQTFTVAAGGYYLIDGHVSRGSLPVAKLYYYGVLVDEVSVTREECVATPPPATTTPEETTGGTTDIQDIGEPTTGSNDEPVPGDGGGKNGTPEAVEDGVGSDEVPEAIAGGGQPQGGGEEARPADDGGGAGVSPPAPDVTLIEDAEAGAVPDARSGGVAQVDGELPDTGGTPLLLPLAALLLGCGLVAYRIVR